MSQYTWFWMAKTYAGRRLNKKKLVFLHRFLLGEPDSKVDHRNLDKLDCRRSNLRIATDSGNVCNHLSHSSHGFRGISSTDYAEKPWKASINHMNTRYNLGCFGTKEEAALAYDAAARRLHGQFARLNFPGDGEQSTFEGTRLSKPECGVPEVTLVPQGTRGPPPSGFYGVYRSGSKSRPWLALLCVNAKILRIGLFQFKEDAARAYDEAARKAKGSNAKLNFSY